MERPPRDGAAVATLEEESHAEQISPDEISPELLYTSEHPVLRVPDVSDAMDRRPSLATDADAANKRRRGRRGGRRGRGDDDGPAGSP
jgi:hypothetical protein